jgi:hypothetical protein
MSARAQSGTGTQIARLCADFRRADFPGRISDARGSGCWHAPSMGMLPKLSESDLVRTEFTDSTAWEHAAARAHGADCASRGVRTKMGIVLVVFFWYSV